MPSRRSFLKTTVASGLMMAGGAVACRRKEQVPDISSPRNHPFAGVAPGLGFGVEVIDNPEEKFPYLPGRYDQPRPSTTG